MIYNDFSSMSTEQRMEYLLRLQREIDAQNQALIPPGAEYSVPPVQAYLGEVIEAGGILEELERDAQESGFYDVPSKIDQLLDSHYSDLYQEQIAAAEAYKDRLADRG